MPASRSSRTHNFVSRQKEVLRALARGAFLHTHLFLIQERLQNDRRGFPVDDALVRLLLFFGKVTRALLRRHRGISLVLSFHRNLRKLFAEFPDEFRDDDIFSVRASVGAVRHSYDKNVDFIDPDELREPVHQRLLLLVYRLARKSPAHIGIGESDADAVFSIVYS